MAKSLVAKFTVNVANVRGNTDFFIFPPSHNNRYLIFHTDTGGNNRARLVLSNRSGDLGEFGLNMQPGANQVIEVPPGLSGYFKFAAANENRVHTIYVYSLPGFGATASVDE